MYAGQCRPAEAPGGFLYAKIPRESGGPMKNAQSGAEKFGPRERNPAGSAAVPGGRKNPFFFPGKI